MDPSTPLGNREHCPTDRSTFYPNTLPSQRLLRREARESRSARAHPAVQWCDVCDVGAREPRRRSLSTSHDQSRRNFDGFWR